MPDYRVDRARPDDLERLVEIERAAGEQFRGRGISDEALDWISTPEDFAPSCAAGTLWVMRDDDGRAVAFAQAERWATSAHLEEIDVHPEHGRRGLGARLIEAVRAWARAESCPRLTLTTYRDIPWNAPYYARLGFRVLGDEELGPELRERIAHEAEHGLDPAQRVAMALEP